MAQGNPSPVPRPENLTAPRFKKGQSGNPGGLPRETLMLMKENAARATRIRGLMLAGLEKKLDDAIAAGDSSSAAQISAEINTFLRDSENRGFGTPTQSVQLTGAGGGPVQSISREMTPEEAAEAYRASLEEAPQDDESGED